MVPPFGGSWRTSAPPSDDSSTSPSRTSSPRPLPSFPGLAIGLIAAVAAGFLLSRKGKILPFKQKKQTNLEDLVAPESLPAKEIRRVNEGEQPLHGSKHDLEPLKKRQNGSEEELETDLESNTKVNITTTIESPSSAELATKVAAFQSNSEWELDESGSHGISFKLLDSDASSMKPLEGKGSAAVLSSSFLEQEDNVKAWNEKEAPVDEVNLHNMESTETIQVEHTETVNKCMTIENASSVELATEVRAFQFNSECEMDETGLHGVSLNLLDSDARCMKPLEGKASASVASQSFLEQEDIVKASNEKQVPVDEVNVQSIESTETILVENTETLYKLMTIESPSSVELATEVRAFPSNSEWELDESGLHGISLTLLDSDASSMKRLEEKASASVVSSSFLEQGDNLKAWNEKQAPVHEANVNSIESTETVQVEDIKTLNKLMASKPHEELNRLTPYQLIEFEPSAKGMREEDTKTCNKLVASKPNEEPNALTPAQLITFKPSASGIRKEDSEAADKLVVSKWHEELNGLALEQLIVFEPYANGMREEEDTETSMKLVASKLNEELKGLTPDQLITLEPSANGTRVEDTDNVTPAKSTSHRCCTLGEQCNGVAKQSTRAWENPRCILEASENCFNLQVDSVSHSCPAIEEQCNGYGENINEQDSCKVLPEGTHPESPFTSDSNFEEATSISGSNSLELYPEQPSTGCKVLEANENDMHSRKTMESSSASAEGTDITLESRFCQPVLNDIGEPWRYERVVENNEKIMDSNLCVSEETNTLDENETTWSVRDSSQGDTSWLSEQFSASLDDGLVETGTPKNKSLIGLEAKQHLDKGEGHLHDELSGGEDNSREICFGTALATDGNDKVMLDGERGGKGDDEQPLNSSKDGDEQEDASEESLDSEVQCEEKMCYETCIPAAAFLNDALEVKQEANKVDSQPLDELSNVKEKLDVNEEDGKPLIEHSNVKEELETNEEDREDMADCKIHCSDERRHETGFDFQTTLHVDTCGLEGKEGEKRATYCEEELADPISTAEKDGNFSQVVEEHSAGCNEESKHVIFDGERNPKLVQIVEEGFPYCEEQPKDAEFSIDKAIMVTQAMQRENYPDVKDTLVTAAFDTENDRKFIQIMEEQYDEHTRSVCMDEDAQEDSSKLESATQHLTEWTESEVQAPKINLKDDKQDQSDVCNLNSAFKSSSFPSEESFWKPQDISSHNRQVDMAAQKIIGEDAKQENRVINNLGTTFKTGVFYNAAPIFEKESCQTKGKGTNLSIEDRSTRSQTYLLFIPGQSALVGLLIAMLSSLLWYWTVKSV